MATEGRPGLSAVRDALENAQPAGEVGRQYRTIEEELAEPELPLLPPGCPVQPLGKLGTVCYFLDEAKQLIALKPQELNKNHIKVMFGRKSHLCDEYWPRYSDKSDDQGNRLITGWKPEIAADMLARACGFAGLFDPQGKVRGTGAHRGDNGELVLHCGDKIYITSDDDSDGYTDPGFVGGYVYPAGPSRPRPDPTTQDTKAAELILQSLHAWNWFRPKVDPILLLGWVGCALVGGALKWRPHAWVTGGTGTGKSTLQELLRLLFDGAALTTGDATPAAVRQLLKQQTLPVFFDELEPSDDGDNRRTTEVIKLARLASSGEQALRGGQDHTGAEFLIRSCFLFSSILIPPTLAQDRNRLAIFELDAIEPGKSEPTIDPAELRQFGRQLRKRLVDHWHRLDDLVGRYKTALAGVGHGGRSGTHFGTLLALSDLLLYDVASEDNIRFWADQLRADTLAEKATELPDEEEICQFLSTAFLHGRGGEEPAPIVRHIRDALAAPGMDGLNKAAEKLENNGLRVGRITTTKSGGTGFESPDGRPAKDLYLAIANSHNALERLFDKKRWSSGTWAQSFGRVVVKANGDETERRAIRRVKVRFAGARPQWSTLIPLSAVLDLDQPSH